MIDATTPLGEVKGYYRSTVIVALRWLKKQVEKVKKSEEDIEGETSHLEDREEIIDELLVVLGAKTADATEGTPIGRAIREAESRDGTQMTLDGLDPEGVDIMDDEVIAMMVELTGYDENMDAVRLAIRQWDRDVRRIVYRWAKAMQVAGTPAAVHVKVPPRPLVIRTEWLDQTIVRALELGEREPETLKNIQDPMSDEEITQWLATGPWAPAQDGEAWTLRYNAPGGHGGALPVYEHTHVSEDVARHIAARVNRTIAGFAQSETSVEPPNVVESPNIAIDEHAADESGAPPSGVQPTENGKEDEDKPKRRGKKKSDGGG